MKVLTLENKDFRIGVNQLGGSLTSVYDKQREAELLWTPDERYWKFCDVVIFPLMGKPADGYDVNGKTYHFSMPHGVARTQLFEVESHTGDELILRLCSNEQTLAEYPFEFILRLFYKIENKKYSLTYEVTSKNKQKIPFQVGAHAGFKVPEGQNVLVFDTKENLRNYPMLEGGKISSASRPLFEGDRIDICPETFEKHRSLVLDKLASRGCTLELANGVKLRYDLGGAPRTTVWGFSNGGRFVCVEPWWGLCESPDTPREIFDKELINIAEVEPLSFTYSCEVR